MTLIITKLVRAYCPLCGWMKYYDPNDLNLSPPIHCPACNDDMAKVWQMVEDKLEEERREYKPKRKKTPSPYDASVKH